MSLGPLTPTQQCPQPALLLSSLASLGSSERPQERLDSSQGTRRSQALPLHPHQSAAKPFQFLFVPGVRCVFLVSPVTRFGNSMWVISVSSSGPSRRNPVPSARKRYLAHASAASGGLRPESAACSWTALSAACPDAVRKGLTPHSRPSCYI